MAKRRKLHEISLDNDIRYRGPLSWQSFQILGWLCISLLAGILILELARQADPSTADSLSWISSDLKIISSLSLPFLLIANFSRILNNSEGYRFQLLRTGGAMIGIALVANVFLYRYVIGSIQPFAPEPDQVASIVAVRIRDLTDKGYFAFNIFTDLFLCSLFMFCLNARPRRVFTGKKVIILRLMAIVPVAYEVASIVLKGQAASGNITLPVWSFALLTVKPPMAFVVFLILAIHIKTRERRFCRHGRTHEEYLRFLGTNRNSLHFSLFLILMIILAVIVDFFALVFMSAASAGSEVIESSEDFSVFAKAAIAMGFGESVPLLGVIPFLALYSYSRKPRYTKLSMFIPVIGIALMVLIFMEGIHQMLLELGRNYNPEMLTEMSPMLMMMDMAE